MRMDKSLKISLFCIGESFLYLLLSYILFYKVFFPDTRFLALNLHPFLLIVVFMSLKYGAYLGASTSFMAICFYYLAYLDLGFDPILFFGKFTYFKFIIIFFSATLIFGLLHDRHKRQVEKLTDDINALKKELLKQKKFNVKLTFINSKLKKQIINSRESILTLHHLISSLDGLNVEDTYTKVIENILQFIPSDIVSIYSYNNDKGFIRKKIRVGRKRLENFQEVDKIKAFQDVLVVKKPLEFMKENDGVTPTFIAPILDVSDKVIGFINIERLSFGRADRYTFELFKVITHWLNKILAANIVNEEESYKDLFWEGTKVYKMNRFKERLHSETKRKYLFGGDFLTVELENKGMTPEKIDNLLDGKIRTEDVVALDDDHIRFIFPSVEPEYKGIILKKLRVIFPGCDVNEV